MTQAPPDAEQLMHAYVDVWHEQDYAKIPDLVSKSFVMYDPLAPADEVPGPAGEVHGPDGLEAWISLITSGFPDFQVTIHDTLVSEETLMCETTIMGTHEGEFAGIPPTGREFETGVGEKYLLADGKIQEHRVYFDRLEILEQLGLTDD